MKSDIKWLCIGLSICSFGLYGFGLKTIVGIRSQAVNVGRGLVGKQQLLYRSGLTHNNAIITVTPEYSHSFHAEDIAKFLFGCPELIFSGSQVIGRNTTDILADYFGLPSDFKSVVQFKPTIVNFVMDFDWCIGLDGFARGLYTTIHLPLAHTKWDLNMVECVVDPGMTFTSYPAGYFAATPIELNSLIGGETAPKTVTKAFQGKALFGDMKEPLQYGKIFGRQSESRVAELRVTLGYNFLLSDWYHIGCALLAAAPTGTLRSSKFLFEPIVGNDHHWELGGVFTGHIDFFHGEYTDRKLACYFQVNITHMFTSRQKRSFDLKNNGPGSRYMLLQELASPASGLHTGLTPTDELAPYQYQGFLVPAINKTTLDADIRIGLQSDIIFKLSYQYKGFEFDLGYNVWVRSKEECCGRACIEKCYALKGDAQIYGFTNPGQTPIAVAATQSNATIYQGEPVTNQAFLGLAPGNFNEGFEFANINADNIASASDTSGTALLQLTDADANRLNIGQLTIRTSIPPILLTNSDIDEYSALLPRAVSQRFFFYIGYYCKQDAHVIPYIGGGGFIEFARLNSFDNSATAQWGVWGQMGIAFGM